MRTSEDDDYPAEDLAVRLAFSEGDAALIVRALQSHQNAALTPIREAAQAGFLAADIEAGYHDADNL